MLSIRTRKVYVRSSLMSHIIYVTIKRQITSIDFSKN